MRGALAIRHSPSELALAFRSSLSMLVYRGMELMRVLSPYLFAAVFVLLAPTARAATADESFVQQNIDKAYVILNDGTLTPAQRGEKFHAFMTGIMDTRRVAVFTLGIYARSITDMELDRYADGFSDFATAVLQHDLAGNAGESVTVTGSVDRAADDVIVTARLTGSMRANGAPINLGFRIRKNANGGEKLIDLQVEGVSMAMAQRSDFTSWLQLHHGDVSALTKELQLRAQDFREQNAMTQNPRTASAH